MNIWVVNTSPLVFLGNLGRLELLRHEDVKSISHRWSPRRSPKNPMPPRRWSRLAVLH
jgi:hypothetical protein